jgi:hypothetical protein
MKTNNPPPAKKVTPTAAAKPQATHAAPTAARLAAAVDATIKATPAAGSASRAKPATRAAAATAKPAGPFTPLYLNFSNKPRAIVENMDALAAQAEKANAARTRWGKGPRRLFWAGLGLMALEGVFWFLGYSPSCVFVTGGAALWIVAIFLSVGLRRAQVNAFPPRFSEFEQVIHTLSDDLRPGTGFIGNLDLTGPRQASKVAREAKDTRNRTTQYFRDQWLNFKAKMYDGNILRVSGIQRIKERKGYMGVGKVSHKSKWKPAKFKGGYQELKIRLAVNPDVYKIVRNNEINPSSQIGEYTVNAVDTEGGIITILASSPKEEISAQSILSVLKFTYGLLQPKKA